MLTTNKAYMSGKLWIVTLDYHRHTRKSHEKHEGFFHNNQQGGILIGGKSIATFKRAKREVQQYIIQTKLNPSHGDHRKKYLLNDEELTKAGYKGYEVEAKNLGVSLSEIEERIQKVYDTNTVWKTGHKRNEYKITRSEQRNAPFTSNSKAVERFASENRTFDPNDIKQHSKNEPNNKPLLKSYIKSYKIYQAQKIKNPKEQTNNERQPMFTVGRRTTNCKHWQSTLTTENIKYVKLILNEIPQIKGKYDFKDNIITIDNREVKYLSALIKLVYKCNKDSLLIEKFCNKVKQHLIKGRKWLNVNQVRQILQTILSFSFIDTTLANINKEQLEEFRAYYTNTNQQPVSHFMARSTFNQEPEDAKQNTEQTKQSLASQKSFAKQNCPRPNQEEIQKVINAIGRDNYICYFEKYKEDVILTVKDGKCICKLTRSNFITDTIRTRFEYALKEIGIEMIMPEQYYEDYDWSDSDFVTRTLARNKTVKIKEIYASLQNRITKLENTEQVEGSASDSKAVE